MPIRERGLSLGYRSLSRSPGSCEIQICRMKRFATAIVLILTSSGIAQKKYNLIVGTYTNSCDSKGVYVFDFDPETAETTSHGRDTYRYLPVHQASAPSRRASPQLASEGARASSTNPSDEGLRPLADAIAGLRAGFERKRGKG